MTLAVFVGAVILLSVTPGPDLFLILGRGIAQGRRTALFTALGFFLAGFVQIPLLAFGLARLVAEHPLLFDLLRYAGGLYLVWRGVKMIRSAGPEAIQKTALTSDAAALREGFIASLINPKSHVFLLAFLPQFVNPDAGSVMVQFIILGMIMRCVALMVETSIAVFAGAIGQLLHRSDRLRIWLGRIAGSLLVAVGLRLLLMDRPQDVVSQP